jgi:hypothetical protein
MKTLDTITKIFGGLIIFTGIILYLASGFNHLLISALLIVVGITLLVI